MRETICLRGRSISYELTRKPVKNINLRVRADGSVGVSASPQIPLEEIERVLRAKEEFLLRALDRFAAQPVLPDPGDYAAGAVVFLLGRPHRVVLEQGDENRVQQAGDTLRLTVTDPDCAALRKRTMETWLQSRCRQVTQDLCRQHQPALAPLGVPLPQVRVRSMRSRWGSCQPGKGRVTFARQLLQAPLPCVEYVVCHELVHFVHLNHAKAFYDRLAQILPDWKARRQRLNTPGAW